MQSIEVTAREAVVVQRPEFVLVRVVEPQPHPITEAMRDFVGTDRWWAATVTEDRWGKTYLNPGSDYQEDWRCPFGVPGDVVGFREEFYYSAEHDNYYYQSDKKGLGMKAFLELSGRNPMGPRAMVMPDCAIRSFGEVVEVQCKRVKDLTFDEMSKILMHELGDIGFADWFNREFPDIKHLPNPFVWVGRFKQARKER